ncbi:Dienelactone hydrolase [Blastococcus aurantiacus]|uniref:Dienelactone hydrolase n=1 Tax=Blastococcus aurantiacus TaxID=1550231 RepID=A0A1G7PRQ4_9ACTN|nr:dienelactone hydrolase family protein [Blastococcus aurantiacus]SDF88915.1 Dienelactone hydrolase [Blastococcus aurantiacus]
MTQIALFHSVLGVRPGVRDAADRLRAGGHQVRVVDQYDGQVFDDYEQAGAHVERVGFPALMAAALEGVADLPDGFVAAGFSNGAGMAEHVALQGRCAGVLMVSGALPPAMLGASAWPPGVRVQLHSAEGDPMRHREWDEEFLAVARASGAPVEVFDYPVSGHLFTDPSLPAEFDAPATELLWTRALAFCAGVDAQLAAR